MRNESHKTAEVQSEPPVPGPLNAAEMVEYKRLTSLLDDNYARRQQLALMKAGLAKDPVRLAALDAREAELEAAGCAIAHLRQHLHGRYKWPKIYRGSVPAAH
ncbi:MULTISPECIES: hypothetical protein [unclassified Janthinobacterium]|uniref:hypothetical protein n=1 Tax=unclassified Janthinobacterium TaxID=2610881 RepID=UPI0018C950F4|nr:hypothetical protein [Janthinobacterium sp. CG_23.4]MDH6157407.1 hypothetical protein [Janthinobacterium sp. CG_23.4]